MVSKYIVLWLFDDVFVYERLFGWWGIDVSPYWLPAPPKLEIIVNYPRQYEITCFFHTHLLSRFFTLQIKSQKYCQGFLLDNVCFCHLTFIVKFLMFYRFGFVSQVFHRLFHKIKSFAHLFTSFPQLYTFVKLHKKQSKYLCNIPYWNIQNHMIIYHHKETTTAHNFGLRSP